jgi:hypothetical protein
MGDDESPGLGLWHVAKAGRIPSRERLRWEQVIMARLCPPHHEFVALAHLCTIAEARSLVAVLGNEDSGRGMWYSGLPNLSARSGCLSRSTLTTIKMESGCKSL